MTPGSLQGEGHVKAPYANSAGSEAFGSRTLYTASNSSSLEIRHLYTSLGISPAPPDPEFLQMVNRAPKNWTERGHSGKAGNPETWYPWGYQGLWRALGNCTGFLVQGLFPSISQHAKGCLGFREDPATTLGLHMWVGEAAQS